MKILALDTSGTNCSVSIINDEKVICDFNLSTGTTHSQTLLPMIDTMIKYSEINLEDIDVFACSVGPGSFTGLRIGIAPVQFLPFWVLCQGSFLSPPLRQDSRP